MMYLLLYGDSDKHQGIVKCFSKSTNTCNSMKEDSVPVGSIR